MGNILDVPVSCCKDRGNPNQSSQAVTSNSTISLRLDHRKFEQARTDKNVPGLVALLTSHEPLPSQSRVTTHPWAKAPETLSPLVAAHIAVLLASDKSGVLPDTFVNSGLTEALAELLHSTKADRIHAAAVTLLFLTEKSTSACLKLAGVETLKDLETCYQFGTTGLQLTALAIARNIAKHNIGALSLETVSSICKVSTEIVRTQISRKGAKANDFSLEGLQIIADMIDVYRSRSDIDIKAILINRGLDVSAMT